MMKQSSRCICVFLLIVAESVMPGVTKTCSELMPEAVSSCDQSLISEEFSSDKDTRSKQCKEFGGVIGCLKQALSIPCSGNSSKSFEKIIRTQITNLKNTFSQHCSTEGNQDCPDSIVVLSTCGPLLNKMNEYIKKKQIKELCSTIDDTKKCIGDAKLNSKNCPSEFNEKIEEMLSFAKKEDEEFCGKDDESNENGSSSVEHPFMISSFICSISLIILIFRNHIYDF